MTDESEIFDGASQTFSEGPLLPKEIGNYLRGPCMVQLGQQLVHRADRRGQRKGLLLAHVLSLQPRHGGVDQDALYGYR